MPTRKEFDSSAANVNNPLGVARALQGSSRRSAPVDGVQVLLSMRNATWRIRIKLQTHVESPNSDRLRVLER